MVNPPASGPAGSGTGAVPGGGSSASGVTSNSPGVGSGNNAQLPTDVPVNLCGISGSVVGALNPVMGNGCANQESAPAAPAPGPQTPPVWTPPVQTPPAQTQPIGSTRTATTPVAVPVAAPVAAPIAVPVVAGRPAVGQLAFTGADGLGVLVPAGLGLLIAGGVLYRRTRTAA
ncbi:chaplin [Kitasatospora sp. NBC_01287]|nr:chaplin [Kitasatospora sp. NBC_01287]